MEASMRSQELLEANLSQNKARDLKHGTPDLINHGGKSANFKSTLKTEHPPVAPEAPKNIGRRQQLRKQRARERAMKEIEERDKKTREAEQAPEPEPVKRVSARQALAATLQPKGGRDYTKEDPATFWSTKAGQMHGMTAPVAGGAFRRQNVMSKPEEEQ